MKIFRYFVYVAVLLALGSNSMAFAKGKGSGKGDEKGHGDENRTVNSHIALAAIEGVVTEASGKIKYQVKNKQQRRRFMGKVKIPLPSALPAIADEAGAQSADIRLEISRADVPVALCYLVLANLGDDDDSEESLQAVYKVDVETRVKNGQSKDKIRKGSCDIDLATEAVQSGVPELQDGDIIKARSVSGDVAVDFLQGEK